MLILGVGEQFDLNSTISEGSASQKVYYYSNNADSVGVEKIGGLVTAKEVGTATVVAKTYNEKPASCNVMVKPAPDSISLSRDSLSLGTGESAALTASIPRGTASAIRFESSDKGVVRVDQDGNLFAVAIGTATVTASTFNGHTASCSITVSESPKSVSFENSSIKVSVGEKAQVTAVLSNGMSNVTYKSSDPNLKVVLAEEASLIRPIEEGDAACIIMTLLSIPHGVEKMSMDIPGLVETSSNLAAAHIHGDVLKVITSQRSSVVSELHAVAERVEAAFFLGSFEAEHHGEYPGWKPNLDSRILKVSVDSYKRLFGKEPEVKAIHAGLECGLFLEKFPDLDMISFGPTLRNVHAPGEKLELASLDKFVEHLKDVVVNFS